MSFRIIIFNTGFFNEIYKDVVRDPQRIMDYMWYNRHYSDTTTSHFLTTTRIATR